MPTTQPTTPAPLNEGFQAVRSAGKNTIIRTTCMEEDILDFARSVARGLSATPKRLECRFLYDALGSELYEQITCQPEYYPTRTEAAILAQHADHIRSLTGPVSLVELGSGSSVKTDFLLRAWSEASDGYPEVCYIPVDVSESALLMASNTISQKHPQVKVIGIHSTYEGALPLFSDASPAMVIFLGSTLGNLDEDEAASFFRRISASLSPGDFFLLGIDLEKDPSVLEAAYNDAAGVTARFTRNLFSRMNRELGSGLDIGKIEHQARWCPDRRRIEIHARFTHPQTVRVAPLARSFRIAAGEEILVEISRKFRLEQLHSELETYGLKARETFTDDQGWFGLTLLEKRGQKPLQ